MIDLSKRIANLSPEKRELLRQGLKSRNGNVIQPKIGPQKRDTNSFPLSFAQQRLWFLDQLEPNNSAYNVPAALRLKGPLNVAVLQQSLTEIAQRHEALRTTFALKEGQPVQVIAPVLIPPLTEVDLRSLPEIEREAAALRLAAAEAQRPFELSQGPLLRFGLLRLAEEEYILLLTMHHIISDGWSLGVFFGELAVLYEAFTAGQPSPLPELPIQYADFTIWQREWLQGEVLEAQLSYWKKQLGGNLPVLELPTDRFRPAMQSFQGAHHSFVLSQELTEKLKELSRQERVTLFMVLLAAFKTLLYRYSGQEEIIVGSPIANRNRREVEGLIGFFVNTLVLRTDLRGQPSFREVLQRIREVTLAAYEHQDVPFEKLVTELQLERDLSRTPLFQVMFILQNAPMEAVALPGLSLERVEVESGTAKFDLTLAMIETDQGLVGRLEYNTDLFEAERISRLAGHFQCLLEGVVAAPQQSIASLPLLTAAERHQLLMEWNETATAYPEVCIHQLLEAQAVRTPEVVAVVFEDESLSYGELNRRANQVAHYLRKLGVGPETLVGICLERSLEMVIGLVGILKAGGAYVPLDPAYPPERIAFMLQDAGVSVLLTQKHLLAGLPQSQARVVCLDRDWAIMAEESEQNLVTKVTLENLAYVIYTSGSTGKPKGVQILHRAVVNFLTSMLRQPGLTEQDILLSVTTLSFDIAALEIFLPLIVGARLVVVGRDVAADGPRLLERLTNHKATVMQATPATWRLLLEAGWQGDRQLKILCGGEALPRELANQLLERGTSLWNLYGPTESTIWSTVYEVASRVTSIPIGRPIANTQVYILDRKLQPVPIGVPGELYIGGVGLARGYLNRPELTAEKFILDPFSDEPGGARLYKTGDLAHYMPNGNIEFLGRIDHQVKIRGFRIELGEIEAVLAEHPAVRQTVVVAGEDGFGDKRLVAYVTSDPGNLLTHGELRDFLHRKLPEFMAPSVFAILDTLPLTPNGKIDRRALPAPDMVTVKLEKISVAPRNEVELQLMRIWERVLGIQIISVNDNFFELGGHSLLAVRLLAQIEQVFDKKLPLATLFQAPTIAQLANTLRQTEGAGYWSSLVALQPNGSKPPFFCIPGNLGNVFVDLSDLAKYLGPDQPVYGLQDGIQNPAQVEALAAHYIDEIRTVQAEGPYLLGGICSGGIVAFEMAQQLVAQGQRVALLALIEPSRPPVLRARAYFNFLVFILTRVVKRLSYHLFSFWQRDTSERESYMRLKAKLAANMWAMVRYAPQIYLGRITLFLADESSVKLPHDPRLGWRELTTEGVEVQLVPGTHNTITRTHDAVPEEAHLQVLAERLRTSIDDAVRGAARK